MPPTTSVTPHLVLAGGHESAGGADLRYLLSAFPSAGITAAGRPLDNALARLRARSDDAVVVLPMTLGRDPSFVADAAKTLKWLAAEHPGRIALAEDFGTHDHLTAWLRRAATAVRGLAPEAAVLVTADAANPFDDAELYRIAHLVRTHGAGNAVEVGIDDGRGSLAEALDRLHRLGADEIVVVPAGFARVPRQSLQRVLSEKIRFYGPLMSEHAVARVVRDRTAEALHRLSHGDDGIDAGLSADHGHGYAHSHAVDGALADHGHSHGQHHHHDHSHDQTSAAKGTHNARQSEIPTRV